MKKKKVVHEGNNHSPEEQLAEGMNIIQNCEQPSQMLLPWVSAYAYIYRY